MCWDLQEELLGGILPSPSVKIKFWCTKKEILFVWTEMIHDQDPVKAEAKATRLAVVKDRTSSLGDSTYYWRDYLDFEIFF